MGCSGSSEIDVKRSRIQLFEKGGEEPTTKNIQNKKDSIKEK